MTSVNISEDIKKIVAEILEEEPENIDADAQFVKDLGMDSMMALEILASIEKKYKISIPEEILPKFTTLNETVRLVNGIMEGKK